MSNFERSIVSIIEPKIKVDRIIIEDGESPEAKEKTSKAVPETSNTKSSARWGAFLPLIYINTNRFDQNQIISMNLDITGKIPIISVSLNDSDGKFNINAPHDGDVISLYIKPPDEDNQKPIRIDFDITSITSDPSTKNYGIRGIMKIPGFFSERCKSFKKNTLFDHLQSVCEDVGLGFASNETSTDDSMSRLIPFDTYEMFVDESVKYAYKNDDSFFTWYIDPFYYLCLVNINKQFSLEDKTEEVNISTKAPLDGVQGSETSKSSFKGDLILSNQAEKSGTNIFIQNWTIENNSAATWLNHGYKKYTQYVELEENKLEYISTFVDPLTTEGAEKEYILMKGRSNNDFYKDQNTYKWLGKQSIGNVHDNYIFSKILNFMNLEEIKKISLNVELAGMNFYVYKYMRIPVAIYESAGGGNSSVKKLAYRDNAIGETDDYKKITDPNIPVPGRPEGKPTIDNIGENPRDQIRNDYASGYYVVNSIKYTYEPPGPIKMKLNLIRREWPIPAANKNY